MFTTTTKRFYRLLAFIVKVHCRQAREMLPTAVNYLFSPLIGLNYFRMYLDLVKALQRSSQNLLALTTFKTVNALLLFKMLHFLFLAVFGWQYSDAQRLLHYDALYLLVPKYSFNVFGCLMTGVVVVHNYLLLKRPRLKVIYLLREVLLPDYQNVRKSAARQCSSRHFIYRYYRGKEVTLLIRRFFLYTVKSFHVLLVVIGEFCIVDLLKHAVN